MLFNSYIFLLFFLPLCLGGYFFLNKKGLYKAALVEIILLSFVFYAYNHVQYIFILLGSILGNWIISRTMYKISDRSKKIVLCLGILANIGVIFYFKYYNFFIENAGYLIGKSFKIETILLPLGISFYTFQQISYLVDSSKEATKDYSFLEYAAFVAFFPQLIAGPIVLHGEIIPQFRDISKRKLNQDNVAKGLYILAVGLFKKVIIADTFGVAVNWGYGRVDALTSLETWLVVLFYTFQIYFDFSAYSDMAIGIAKMFNITLPINFDSPYKSYSIIEFWQRWHMTLTRFLRQYIYFPLGGSKKGTVRTCINIFLVFLISGIWHGANWTFIVWGIIHGVAQVLNRIFKKTWDKYNGVFQWLCTFLFINITWMIFRADSLSQAFQLFKKMISMSSFTIDAGLLECFALQEFNLIGKIAKPIGYMANSIGGFWMWLFIFGATFCCLNMTNLHKKQINISWKNAMLTIVLMLWSIVSFSGITTFLYFNF